MRDAAGNTASASVSIAVYNPALYRVGEDPSPSRAGIQVAWYDVTGDPAASALRRNHNLVANVNVPSTGGTFSVSGRADDFGGVYEGYVDVVMSGLYTFLSYF